ncbi:MAG: tRNA (adenosine(37)-N6)-threonylcarbamoyltransferase complex dimerization subunit type 1 TsaB [Legionellaceae bacterium]|nr:tRNA (adenosine(37)-N6)-threonylcarbamoyltransferase complex dimerization subunit type 1 TsaB [Legionellaceae bacterium]
MKLLALDSSTETAQIALSDGQNDLLRELTGVREHSRNMLTQIDAILAEAAWPLSSLDAVVFGCGPGSFTGLRVSCALAQGIAWARDLPLYPVSCLASIVERVRQSWQDAPVLALMDARMQQVYWSFVPSGSYIGAEQVSEIQAITLDATSFILAGKAYTPYLEHMPQFLHNKIERQVEQGPDVGAMMSLVRQGMIHPVSVEKAQPVYIRNQVTQGVSNG